MTEYEILTEEQIQEYLKKYPQLDEADILLLIRMCSKTGVDVHEAIVELAEEAIKIYEQQKGWYSS